MDEYILPDGDSHVLAVFSKALNARFAWPSNLLFKSPHPLKNIVN
jgi:hypothetical protein